MPTFARPSPPHADPSRIDALGRELLDRARARGGESGGWREGLFDWVLRDPSFKVRMFRFIDTYPTLRTPEQVHAVLADYLARPGVTLPPGLGLGLKAGGLMRGALTKTVDRQVRAMARRFIVGESMDEALPRLRERWGERIAFSVDLLGEACVSEAEAREDRRRYRAMIAALPGQVASWPADERLERDHLGDIPRCNVSIKVSSLHGRVRVEDFDGTIERMIGTVTPILEDAAKQGVFINFDMEHHQLKDLTLALFMRCCERVDFPAGVALQAYLRSAEADAQRLIDWAKRVGRVVTVRLVKGAYWDYERIVAERNSWPSPVWPTKGATDACFERVAGTLIGATPRRAGEGGVKLALGSHNARSIAAALAHVEASGLPRSAVELQMLYGMADALKAAAAAMGCRVREYAPIGDMVPGMAYLVRRLLENTSNESWLKAGFHDDRPVEALLAKPQAADVEENLGDPTRHALSADATFTNEPLRDFADAARCEAFARAIAGARVPSVANDATIEDADRAVAAACEAQGAWASMEARHRSDILRKAAEILRSRRDELAGVMVREAGKPWREADGDVCEAVDFLEFYAREAVALFEPRRLGRFIGEHNAQLHAPRGVAAVISPWNFPLAICAGMTSAALAAGNAAIVKPAEQTPGIARLLCDVLWRAGVPRDVLHFLPGAGEVVGAHLVRHPRIALIAFTGSKQVGLDILAAAHRPRDGQRFVKHVVCEMGGKNAIIVDATADIDEAVPGVVQSAFGYAGQKCSACSRAIVLDDVHDAFVERLIDAARDLVVGDPLDPGTDLGPVIDRDAHEKIRRYIDIGRDEGVCAFASDAAGDVRGKPLGGPHVLTGIEPHHRLAREEVFGPVLAVIRARDFDDALRIANAGDYKLTGGLYSRTPAHVERATHEFLVGNLYLNRGIIGALVARQPFGGFGLSGGGTQAGGRDYLLHFVLPRVVTENTLRRGFAPED